MVTNNVSQKLLVHSLADVVPVAVQTIRCETPT